ncbi:MAG: alpha-mannosidase [Ruminococcaceae bacterium]|nr:alpha-mannosidase [Oscillospiraceae bacterium]
MKNKLYVISHTHWDREWYMSFESHRARLVELMDSLIDLMEKEPDYKYFHLDGQTIVIEDYLEIKPFMKDRLDALIKEGRIKVGPWYVLQDETLISGEANVRNMIEGMNFCKENGYPVTKVGYFPDAFANISQAPQLLNGFGFDNAVFGRGLGAVMADNKVGEVADDKELIWEGADGSRVMGIMFTEWYDNANEMPTDKEKCKEKMDKMISLFEKYAKTPHWLGMNGSDHQPVQRDLAEALNLAREIYGEELQIVHSNFDEYLSAVGQYKSEFPIVKGELTGQKTSGRSPISDTASTHQPLKNKNHKVQNLLEQQSEPISVMSYLCGDIYKKEYLRYGWKKLMQNHPHDSICACSCDDVAIQMSARFDCARDVGEYIRNEAAEYICAKIDTSSLGEKSIVVFHTNPFETKGTVTAEVWLKEESDFYIADEKDNVVNSHIVHHGNQFTFKLPKDSFRVPVRDHKYTVKFPVVLSGVGYSVFKIKLGKAPLNKTDLTVYEKGAENKYIRFNIENDGTITLFDKISKKEYKGLNLIEDVGDKGNGYNFIGTDDQKTVFAKLNNIELSEKSGFHAVFKIESQIDIPKGIDENNNRTQDFITHKITNFVTIKNDSRRLDFKFTVNNQSENHRLRTLFTTDTSTPYVYADGQFDVIKRTIKPDERWKNPCYNQRLMAFVSLEDEKSGFMVASRGLNSYEVIRDGKNTVALTLLRATGTLGDWTWGQKPDPLMQVKGEITLEYSILPFALSEKAEAYNEAYSFNSDGIFALETDCHNGNMPLSKRFIEIKGEYLRYSALKKAENSDDLILRVYNVSEEEQKAVFNLDGVKIEAITNLAEDTDREFDGKIAPKKIMTYRLKKEG